MQFSYNCFSNPLNYPLLYPSTARMESKNHLLCEHKVSSISKYSVDPGLINCKASGDWFWQKRLKLMKALKRGELITCTQQISQCQYFCKRKRGWRFRCSFLLFQILLKSVNFLFFWANSTGEHYLKLYLQGALRINFSKLLCMSTTLIASKSKQRLHRVVSVSVSGICLSWIFHLQHWS